MAIRAAGLVCVAVAALAWLQPCSSLPVDARELSLRRWEKDSRERGDDLCLICQGAVELIREYLEANTSINTLYPIFKPMCVYIMHKTHGYNGEYMCPGIVHAYGPVVLDVVSERALKPLDICYLLHLCNKTTSSPLATPPALHSVFQSWKSLDRHPQAAKLEKSVYHWSSEERRKQEPPSAVRREKEMISGIKRKQGDTIVFVQLSDIHLDRQFSEGSPSVCNLYLCCRSWYNGTNPAGHYGNYTCDLPLVTLDLVVEAITELDPQPDFIIYTGDNSPHDLWNETWTSQFQATEYLVSYLSEKLPNRRIYPALGNHETFPESEYIGTLPQYQELTRRMAQYWQSLVPLPQSALDTISDGAYYTLLIEDNLRLVSFNSDYGYSTNIYSALNGQNPYYSRQQAWITDTLQQAEQAGEKVIIIAHVPPGDPGDTLHSYEEFYLNLTKRYRGIIVGHLFGHTHHDEFKLIQDKDGVYGTVMMCPSVTPQGRSNPSFRVFTMDAATYQLQGYQQFHLNLTLANEYKSHTTDQSSKKQCYYCDSYSSKHKLATKGVKPKVELAYTTSDFYHLADLSPASWAGLVDRFTDYPELVSEYRYNKYGRSSSHDLSCDSLCVRETICTVSNIVSLQRLKCIGG